MGQVEAQRGAARRSGPVQTHLDPLIPGHAPDAHCDASNLGWWLNRMSRGRNVLVLSPFERPVWDRLDIEYVTFERLNGWVIERDRCPFCIPN